ARALDGEHEAVRRRGGPLAPALGLLGGIVGGVDLDRRQPAAHEVEFVRLAQAVRVEHPAPGLEHPAADARPDPAAHDYFLLAAEASRMALNSEVGFHSGHS